MTFEIVGYGTSGTFIFYISAGAKPNVLQYILIQYNRFKLLDTLQYKYAQNVIRKRSD